MITPKHLFVLILCFASSLEISSAASQKIEVTAKEYCSFLNRVPATDAAALYEEKMASSASILRIGTPGSYNYILSEEAGKPITYVDQTSNAYYQAGYLPEEELLSSKIEEIDPFLKSNQLSLSSALEMDLVTKTKSRRGKKGSSLSKALGTLTVGASLMTDENERKSPDVESHNIRIDQTAATRVVTPDTSRRVSFDPETENLDTPSRRSQEKSGRKTIKRISQKLEQVTSGIKIALRAIPQEAPDKADQIANVYTQASSDLRTQIEKLLPLLKNEASFQTQENITLLANTATEFINASFYTVNLERINPIKILKEVPNNMGDLQKIFRAVPSSDEIGPTDCTSMAIISTGQNIINDLRAYITVLQNPNDQAGQALHEAQNLRAAGIYFVTAKKVAANTKKVNCLRMNSQNQFSPDIIEAQSNLDKATRYFQTCGRKWMTVENSPPPADPNAARASAIADILTIVEAALPASNQVRALLTSRVNQ